MKFHKLTPSIGLVLGLIGALGAQGAVSLIDSNLPQGTIGQPYNASIQGTGGTFPYTHSISSGSLPTGVALSPAGVFSGTPQTAGQFNFAVQTTDSASGTAVTNLTLRIVGTSSLVLSPATLPVGRIGSALDFTFAATGGTGPYSFDIPLGQGSIPPGLAFSSAGRLNGTPTASGVYPFTVRVTDASGNSFQASQSLRVDAALLTISTTSLAGASANVPYSQTINAVGGTPPYSFGLLNGSLPSGLNIATNGVISGVPTSSGTYNFFVRVTDSASMAAQASFSISVLAGVPTILAPTLPNAILNQPYTAALLAQGGSAPYQFQTAGGALPPGITLGQSGALSGTPTSTGVFPVTVRVNDAGGLSSQRDIILNVNSSQFSIGGVPPDGLTTSVYSYALTSSGGTGPIAFNLASGTLPPGLTLGANGSISGTPTAAGTYSFVVRGVDSAAAVAQLPLTIRVQASNLGILQSGLANAVVGQPYTSTLTATNGAAPYTFMLVSGALPPGLTLSANGNVSGIATSSGLYQAVFKVTDANNATAQATVNLFVSSTTLNITTITLPSARVAQAYTTTLTASGGTLPYTYQLSNGTLPAGLTLSANGVISGTPTTSGSSTFTIRVMDGSGATAQSTYSFNVNGVNGFTLSPASLLNAQTGKTYSVTYTLTGGSIPYTFVVDSGALPPGLGLTSAGVLSGTPTATGTYVFSLKASDSAGITSTFAQSLTVNSSNLAFVETSVPVATPGVDYFTAFTGAGGTAPYSFSLVTGTLPPGLTLGSGGTVSGVPGSTGSYPVTLRITDAAGNTATANFTFVVGGSGSLSITTNGLQTARNGQLYNAAVLASGGRAPYIFNFVSGTLPPGIALSNSGVLSGIPTTDGAYTFAVRVTDSNGTTSQTSLTLNVTSSGIGISPDTLNSGQLGQSYGVLLAGSGGISPYSFTVVSGTLPAGLTLSTNGNLSGVPTVSGVFPLLIRSVDASGAAFQRAYTLIIGSTGLAISTTTLPQPYIGQQYNATLQATGGTGPYTFSILSGALPSGLSLATNGQITGIPETVSQAVVSFRVVDAAQATATATLALLPIQSNLNLLFSSLPAANLGQAYSFTATATGGTAPYTFSAVGALPAGLTISSAGVISGTPTQEGTFNVGVRVQDSLGSAIQANFALTVSGSGFRFTNLTLPAAVLNQAYSQSLRTAGGTGTVTYSLASGSLPAGITLSSAGVLAGTPTAAGTASFTIRATDGNQATANATFSLQVTSPTVSFATSTLASGIVNNNYNQSLGLLGGTPPYTLTITSGALPAGLTLSNAGVIAGTPTAAGNFSFAVRATDSTGSSSTGNFLIGIGAVGAAQVTAVTSAANYNAVGVSPGEVLTLFGTNLGPGNLLTFTVNNNSVATMLGGTRVLFDGVPAPVIYTSSTQVAAVAPFSLSGKTSVQVVVEYQGVASPALLFPVRTARPAIFTIDSSGNGQGAILNQDGSVNSSAKPAKKNSTISIYLTGVGQTNPAQVDGQLMSTTANLVATATATINNLPAVVSYAGNAPGLIPGVAQFNLTLPAGTVSGPNAIKLTVSGVETTSVVTVQVE